MQKTSQAPAIEQIEWDVIEGENTEFAVKYPRMQWAHGEKKASDFNKSGGLFISEDEYPNFEAEGFQPTTFITRKKDLLGYGTASAKLAVIRVKHQWVKDDKQKNVPLCHVLAVVKGSEDLICISLKGPSKALEFQKAFNQHMAHNVSLANRSRPEKVPALEPFALWFPIKAGDIQIITSQDGKNESSVTLPTMESPKTLDRDYVASLWVGKENYKRFASYYKETAAWQKVEIWQQRHDEETEDPQWTGNGEPATDEQLSHIINLGLAKGYDEADVMKGITGGALNKYDELSREDARLLLEKLKTA